MVTGAGASVTAQSSQLSSHVSLSANKISYTSKPAGAFHSARNSYSGLLPTQSSGRARATDMTMSMKTQQSFLPS